MKEKKVYKLSFSEFTSYLQCPHKWYLSSILGLKTGTNDELVFGQLVHKTLENIFTSTLWRKPTMLEGLIKANLKLEIEKIDDVNYLQKFNGSGLSYVFVKQAHTLITELNFFIRFKDYEIVKVEEQLDGFLIIEFEDLIFVFKGYIDLILKHKNSGRILIVDWKTSGTPWDIKKKLKDNEDFFAQLGLYKKFYSEKKNIPLDIIDVKFYNLPRNDPKEQQSFDGILNEIYLNNLFKKMKAVASSIYEQNYNKLDKVKLINKKNYCHRCKFNTEEHCNDIDEHQIIY